MNLYFTSIIIIKNFDRTDADYLDKVTFEKYKKYMKGREWYD